jgi:hypothetical protein
MRIIHKQAVQAHAVPKQVIEARGPFRKYEPEVVALVPEPEFPYGANAQNGMRGVRLYQCNVCGDVVREEMVPFHVCADAAPAAPE